MRALVGGWRLDSAMRRAGAVEVRIAGDAMPWDAMPSFFPRARASLRLSMDPSARSETRGDRSPLVRWIAGFDIPERDNDTGTADAPPAEGQHLPG